MSSPAGQIRKLVAMADSRADGNEAAVARTKAREALAQLDVELLDTLAGQRERLRAEIAEEQKWLRHRDTRPGSHTSDLMDRAALLLGHYEKVDALIAAVLLLRIENGHQLTGEERQQLDGPVESTLDQWFRESARRRNEEREAARQRRRAERRQKASSDG